MQVLSVKAKSQTRWRWIAGSVALLLVGLTAGTRAEEDGVFQDPGISTSASARPVARTERPAPAASTQAVAPAPQPIPVAAPSAASTAEKSPEPAPVETAKAARAEDVSKAADGEKSVPLSAMLNAPMPEEEKPIYEIIQAAAKSGGAGSRAILTTKKLKEISTGAAAYQALDYALNIQLLAHTDEYRRFAIEEARSVFMPVFSVGPRIDSTVKHDRLIELTTDQKIAEMSHIKYIHDVPGGTNPFDPDQAIVKSEVFFKTGEVQFVDPKDKNHFYVLTSSAPDAFGNSHQIVVQQDLTKRGDDPNFAKVVATDGGVKDFLINKKLGYVNPLRQATEMSKTWNYNVASRSAPQDVRASFPVTISQQLPWGPQLVITDTQTRRDLPYDSFHHSFGRPWYTSLSASLYVPLPFTKNFGPYAAQDTTVKLAKLAQQQALWDLKAVINTTIEISDISYLNLVQTMRNLESAINNRKSVEALQTQTSKLLELQRRTQYGMDQVDAEVLRVRQVEEAAWAAFIQTSDSMVNLLNLPADTILIPVGYSKLVQEHATVNAEEALSVALKTRAELKSAAAATASAEVLLKFQKQQSRPDLSVTGSATLSQTQLPNGGGFFGNTGIGFRNPVDAMKRTFTPDTVSTSGTFTYRRPLFNRAEHARVREAQYGLESAVLTGRITENAVTQQVNDALATLATAAGGLQAATVRRDSARAAFDLTLDLQRQGRITEFELISRSQERLDAEFGLNAALIAYKQAETQLSFAQGVLPVEYPERTAGNEFDKYRLGLLKASAGLQFFGNGKD